MKLPGPRGAFLLLLVLVSCSSETPPRSFAILAVNDVYRIDGVAGEGGRRGGLARLRTLRRSLEQDHPSLLFLHAGDFLHPSLLSLTFLGRQMVDVLNLMNGDQLRFDERMFVTFGNHEFDIRDPEVLDRRIDESQFRWLASDLSFREVDGFPVVSGNNLVRSHLIVANGITVGLFSLSSDMKNPDYVDFADPIQTARRMTADLRQQGAEVIVALTHLRLSQDREILETLGGAGPDLIIGGHEHAEQRLAVHGRLILKANADAVSATVAHVTLQPSGPPVVDSSFVDLGPAEPAADARVQAVIDGWLARHDGEFCGRLSAPADCLDEPFGVAGLELFAEETEIRRYETNFGNWVADLSLEAFPKASVALIGSGTLRLNQNIPAGEAFTRRHLVELLPFSTRLNLLKVKGSVLRRALEHSVETWTGNGWWLQVSGVAFRHDAVAQTVSDVTILSPGGPEPLRDETEYFVVANDYIAEGQDGYTMLGPAVFVPEAESPDLVDLITRALKTAGDEGIRPEVEGRICNPDRPGPCLAIAR